MHHIILLEDIIELEAEIEYPIVVERSKTRARYCVECKLQDKKTRAIWFCIDCLEEQDRKVYLCDECALKEHDPLCMETLRLFAEIYGAEAGNLALKTMSLGGVYIGGGIAPKILPILSNHHFMNGFLSKGRFNEMLQGMQVKVSLNPDTALLGAGYFAFDRLSE